MYYEFFGFREPPFSIAPDPRYLYLSDRHKEALAHLMYGVQGQGGFIIITGEVGTGKTTVSRCFIENVPDHVDIALVVNPNLSARELLSAICDELEIGHAPEASIKELVSLINDDLLAAYAAGRHKVLMIDEAQNLSAAVLEQLRLLTNLETSEKKLL
jgi:general secretion pathway protein A